MTKIIIIVLASTFGSLLMTYSSAAFITLQLNPTNWAENDRACYLGLFFFFSALISPLSIALLSILEDESKTKKAYGDQDAFM